jgi:hypothetical protein
MYWKKLEEHFHKLPPTPLPEKGFLGDLTKGPDGLPYVYLEQGWISLEEANKLMWKVQ